jgi:hypothetical protein
LSIFNVCSDVPITDYEKERALNVMRNNMLRSLGITGLTSLIRSSKTRKNYIAHDDFVSLYEPDHNEDNDDHVADQVFRFLLVVL